LNSASLPVSHGRLLHAALLDFVRKYDEVLAESLHDSNTKAFSIGLLEVGKLKPKAGDFRLEKGTCVFWKVCSLDEKLTSLLLNINKEFRLRIGQVSFVVEVINFGFEDNVYCSLCEPNDLVEKSNYLVSHKSFTIHFLTPTTFRYYEEDYPFPRADLIFGSLCERWNRLSDSLTFDSEQLKSIAQQYLIPIKWKGETRRVNLSSKAGVTGFVGSFTFDMKALPEEYRRIFIILVEFALFSGIGRLTGQGLGNIKVDYD
jgi:CRISPR-associated endoribonuclease Cas6